MRNLVIGGLMVACLGASASFAQSGAAQGGIVRSGPAEAAIAATVALPADAKLVYVSGTVPDPVKADAPPGSVELFGDTEAQTRSVLGKIEGLLKAQGLGMGDVVMMRVFLVAPPGQKAMDFAGMMRGYRSYFGTPQQPLKTARSTMQVAGLVDPDWLVEIEVTAARR